MRPLTQLVLLRLAMFGGALLCFGVAMAVYAALGVNLPLLPLWLNLTALVAPILVGLAVGYWVIGLVPLVCPTCGERIVRRRVEGKSQWHLPTYRSWCEHCQRDGMEGKRVGRGEAHRPET